MSNVNISISDTIVLDPNTPRFLVRLVLEPGILLSIEVDFGSRPPLVSIPHTEHSIPGAVSLQVPAFKVPSDVEAQLCEASIAAAANCWRSLPERKADREPEGGK